MIRWIKRYLHRRDIIRRLIAYAKTPEGRTYIEKINGDNLIIADWEAEILGAEPGRLGWRIRLPNEEWKKLNKS